MGQQAPSGDWDLRCGMPLMVSCNSTGISTSTLKCMAAGSPVYPLKYSNGYNLIHCVC